MARAKKEKLSLEELLEQALVKEEEQPYEVLSNWVWTKLGNLLRPMTTKKPNKEEDVFEYIDIEVVDNKKQRISEPKKILVKDAPSRASREISYGDTLFSLVRPYLKNIAFVEEGYEKCIASTGFYVCKPKRIVYPLYLYNLLCSEYVVNSLNQFMKGDNSPSIRGGELEMCNVPLPPLAEQQRIVNRIESLFEKLDTAKELAQNALDSFENRKAAILHKAFTRELTAKWREEHGVSLDSWEEKILKDVVQGFKYGVSEKSDYDLKGMGVIRIPNIISNQVNFVDLKYLAHRDINVDNQIQENDLLVIRSNGSKELVGKCALVPELNKPYTYASYLIRIHPDKIESLYLLYFLNSGNIGVNLSLSFSI